MTRFAALLLLTIAAGLAGLVVLPAPTAPAQTFRLWRVDELFDVAAVFAGKLDRKQAQYVRFASFQGVVPARRPKLLKALGYVVNSWSRNDLIALPQEVPGTEGALAWFDLSQLRDRDDHKGLEQLVRALDQLGELGSGSAPFPEPFFHVVEFKDASETQYVSQDYGLYYDAYGQGFNAPGEGRAWRTTETRQVAKTVRTRVKKVSLSPALNQATTIGLVTVTRTNFPIFDVRWLVANGLVEPRYHELLGLDDTEASAKKLAAVDFRTADRVGAQVRGAVLFSEVAHHNRILERTPTLLRFGRGSFQESFDYKTSVDLQDVLKDVLQNKPDAHEIIFSLPNGLLGWLVTDGNGKRLDKADGDIAANRRSRFRDTQVRTAYHCIACHLPDKGWIEVDDEVRAFATKTIKLLSLAIDERDRDRGKRVRQKYLSIDFNELLRADQSVVEASTLAATGGVGRGLTCAETAKEITSVIYGYNEVPVTAEQLALELGAPVAKVLAAVEKVPGLDHTLVGLRTGRKQRRDQIEAAFGQIATVLYLGK